MPTTPSPAQSETSRANGALSAGPTSDAGKARSALNGVRHGLCGRTFFLLPDEDPAEFRRHEAMWLAVWNPRDPHEHEAAGAAVRAMWREIRADRLEAQVLTDLFAADALPDEAERRAAKAAAMRALGTLLRYRARVEREHRQAMEALESLRQRRLARPQPVLPSEPEPAGEIVGEPLPSASHAERDEPEPTLNRHQRRALAAIERRALRRAA